MLNTYMSYNPPHLDQAIVWLNLDPTFRDYTAGTSNVQNWKNAIDINEIYTQSNSARRPLDTGSAYSFDGGDWLASGAEHTLDTSNGGWTMVVRYAADNWTVSDAILGDDSGNNTFIKNNGNSGLSVKAYDGSSISTKGLAFDDPATLTNLTFYNIILTCDSTGEMFCFIDNVKQAATPNFPNNGYDLILDEVGGKNGNTMQFTGDVHEVLLFNTYLTDIQCNDVSKYLQVKFIAL